MDARTLASLLDAWLLTEPREIRQLDSGTNNLSYRVTTSGGEFLLRVYREHAQQERIAYEHLLLSTLGKERLSFAVPVPLAIETGGTWVPTPDGSRYAAVFPWLPGEHPSITLDMAHICGKVLAELDIAMARLPIGVPSTGVGLLGDLHNLNPAVPDPIAMIEQLPLPLAERAKLTQIMEMVIVQRDVVYGNSLPQQIVHRDLDTSNLLMADGRVTAVFDFEFARPDLRAFDLAISMMTFSTDLDLREAFAAAYTEVLTLTREEMEAIPMLMLIYRAMSLISREGRRRQGLGGEGAVLARARGFLAEARRQGLPLSLSSRS